MTGYRNIYYNNFTKEAIIWKWDKDGKRIEEHYPFEPYIYVETQTDKFDKKSIYNTNLKKLTFPNEFERRKYVKESNIKRIFYNLPVEQQVLIEYFRHTNENPNFSKFPLKIFYFDIETNSQEFPDPYKAKDPINLITIYDSLSEQYYTWGLNNSYTPKSDKHHYYRAYSEEDLLKNFIKFWKGDYCDILSGWNSSGFDLPYIINRITNILGETFVKELSPVGQLYKRDFINEMGKTETKWTIKGIAHIDYMEAYITFAREKRASYSLNNIAEDELGEGKLTINATSLTTLAENDWGQFVDYNVKDVELLVKLEKKLLFLKMIRELAYIGMTNFEAALGTISIVTGAMALKALKRDKIIPTFKFEITQNYIGGYVKEPEPGLYKGLVTFDVNSLYPNTIITLNISPETKVGKIIKSENDIVTFELTNGKEYNLERDKFIKFLNNEKIAISAAKILFSQKERGICGELIDEIYQKRIIIKNKIKELTIELKKHSKDSKIHQDIVNEIDQLDLMQHAKCKIFLNRIYGTYANKHSPFYDIDCASSITTTGQAIIKAASEFANEYTKQKYGVEENLIRYADTDSCIGQTLITTNNGIFEIEKLFEMHQQSNNTTTSNFGHEIIDVSNDDLKCLTFFEKQNLVDLGKIKKIIRHKVKKNLYKIKSNGKEVVITEDHSIMIFRNNVLMGVKPNELKKSDKLISIYNDTC
jgi:DNA polymerase elongation subunit (family B)